MAINIWTGEEMDPQPTTTSAPTIGGTIYTNADIKQYILDQNASGLSEKEVASTIYNRMQETGLNTAQTDAAMGYDKGFSDSWLTKNLGGAAPTSNAPTVSPSAQTLLSPTAESIVGKSSAADFQGSQGLANAYNARTDKAFQDMRIQNMQTLMPQYRGIFNPAPSSSAKGAGTKGAAQAANPAQNSSSMKGV